MQERLVDAHRQREALYERTLSNREDAAVDYSARVEARVAEAQARTVTEMESSRRSLSVCPPPGLEMLLLSILFVDI